MVRWASEKRLVNLSAVTGSKKENGECGVFIEKIAGQ